jgi:predicted nucleic acid-binding protein
MKRVFVDANVFLRFFVGDDERQQARAERLFLDATRGKLTLVTGPPVLFEVAWTLRGPYGVEPSQILEVLARIAALPGLELADAGLVGQALLLAHEKGQEFADAYIAAGARAASAEAIATFNRKDFERLGLTLHEF